MRLSRALSDLVKYTKSVRVHDIETQGTIKRHHSKVNIQLEIFTCCVIMYIKVFGNGGLMYFFSFWQHLRTVGRYHPSTRRL